MRTMYPGVVNSPSTSVASEVSAVAVSITVVDASVLPAGPNICTLGITNTAETILYQNKSGNTLTGVTRALQGTAKVWPVGTSVSRTFTEYDYESLRLNLIEENEDSEKLTNKNQNNGYCGLNSVKKVPISNLYTSIPVINIGEVTYNVETPTIVYFTSSDTEVLPTTWDVIQVVFKIDTDVTLKSIKITGIQSLGEGRYLTITKGGSTAFSLDSGFIYSVFVKYTPAGTPLVGDIQDGFIPDASVTDAKIGPREIEGVADTLSVLLTNLATMVKSITGEDSWIHSPPESLASLLQEINTKQGLLTSGDGISIDDDIITSDVPTLSIAGKKLYGTTFVDIVDGEIFLRDGGTGDYLLTLAPNGEVYAKDLTSIGGI